MNEYIYLSPHLDDVVLSCGAIINDQIRRHEIVKIWTIFAGDSPQQEFSQFAQEIHKRWNTGPQAAESRRTEDTLACERLQAISQHFHYPDCIYRTLPESSHPLIEKEADLFQSLPISEQPLIDKIVHHLRLALPAEYNLVIPLGIGNHIDHQIVRKVGETLNRSRFYYADFPYSIKDSSQIIEMIPPNSSTYHFPLNNQSLAIWQYAVEAYASQISTFWSSLSEMYQAIETYAQSPLGNCLWLSDKSESSLH